ncbi:lipase family protein [Candidatus Colwellia aromaticivorans]|uniref:lipase family protein n=1 Tax=Candidatus Colwellia aromaticivorans TaxID=2267621 RepID=UPI000DF1CDA6|nr:lipase family protein [Candidatus Colwellia aromaticivorans]
MEYFLERSVFKTHPIKRAAYSDRTSWLLAEFSRLVYEELPQEKNVGTLISDIKNLVDTGKVDTEFDGLVKDLIERSGRNKSNVEAILETNKIRLVDSFVKGETEALLAEICNGEESFLVLSFRGTSSAKDAFTDAKLMLQPAIGGGLAHKGFHDGIHLILDDVRNSLSEQGNTKPLYITGHSLGGAWAMLATKYLQEFNIGATYTFGCPRAADDEFYENVRSPVYRVVHRADIVTRLPFGYGMRFSLNLLRLIPINGSKRLSEWLRKKLAGYTHYGNLVYIQGELKTTAKPCSVTVKHSPNIFIVLEDFWKQIVSTFGNVAKDHFIINYCEKLAQIAKDRIL